MALNNSAIGIAIGAARGRALGAAMGRARQGMDWQAAVRQNRLMVLPLGLGVVGLLVGLGALLFFAAR